MENPCYSKEDTLLAQKILLEYKRNRLNGLIELINDVIHGINTMSFEAFNSDDVNKMLDHALEVQNADDNLALNCVARLAKNYKSMFRLENARYLLLKVANDYLNEQKNPEVISKTEEKFGVGITNYIGLAIKRHYGV